MDKEGFWFVADMLIFLVLVIVCWPLGFLWVMFRVGNK